MILTQHQIDKLVSATAAATIIFGFYLTRLFLQDALHSAASSRHKWNLANGCGHSGRTRSALWPLMMMM